MLLRRIGLGFQASPIFSTIRRYASMPEKALMLLPSPPEKAPPPETEKALMVTANDSTGSANERARRLWFQASPIYSTIRRYALEKAFMLLPSPPEKAPPPETEKSLMVTANSTGYWANEILMEYIREKIRMLKFSRIPLLTRPILPNGLQHYTPLSDDIPSDGYLIMQLMLKVCAGDRLLSGKGLWAAYVFDKHVISIRRHRSTKGEKAVATSLANLEVLHLSAEDMTLFETVWTPHVPLWIRQAVLHSRFSKTYCIPNYIYMAGHLFARFLGGGSQDIPKILKGLAYYPGRFYEALEMNDKVSKRLGIVIYPIFKLEDGIPCLDYFAVATDITGVPITHPTASLLRTGMILIPRL